MTRRWCQCYADALRWYSSYGKTTIITICEYCSMVNRSRRLRDSVHSTGSSLTSSRRISRRSYHQTRWQLVKRCSEDELPSTIHRELSLPNLPYFVYCRILNSRRDIVKMLCRYSRSSCPTTSPAPSNLKSRHRTFAVLHSLRPVSPCSNHPIDPAPFCAIPG